jgi:hypothetical protein
MMSEQVETEETVLTDEVETATDETVVTTEETVEEKPTDGEGKSDKVEKDGAPEAYEDFKMPEGFEVDENLLGEAKPIFKELNLNQDQAQRLVDFQAKYMAQLAEAQNKAWNDTIDGWRTAAKDDKEIGGVAFKENVALAREAIKAYGNDEFKNMLNVTGTGDNPEMIRFLYKIGKAVSDDKVLQGQGPAAGKTAAQILYPDMK